LYRFKIYTEDEYGNKSKPVETTGKPFTDEEKNAYVMVTSYTASASKAAIQCVGLSYLNFCGLTYSYTDKYDAPQEGNSAIPNFTVRNLPTATTTPVNLSYKIYVPGMIDTIEIKDVLAVTTALSDPPLTNVVLYKSSSFLTVSGILNNSATFAPSFAGDGVRYESAPATNANNVFWASENSFAEHWLAIDLQNTYEISALTLWRSMMSSHADRKQQKFSFQAWVNDTWVDVLSEENNTDWPYYKEFEPVVTDKVRYYVPPYTDNRTFLLEIEVWGSIW
jgi:hypothetical protein